jgi:hypothetical protein
LATAGYRLVLVGILLVLAGVSVAWIELKNDFINAFVQLFLELGGIILFFIGTRDLLDIRKIQSS